MQRKMERQYLWQSTMADGMIASATVVDAQINYNLQEAEICNKT
jgi:hypothetical protein